MMVHMASKNTLHFCTQESFHLAHYRISLVALGSLHHNGIQSLPQDHCDGALKGALIKGKDVWQHKYNVGNEFHHNFVPILRPKGFVAGFSSLVHSKGLVGKAGLIAMVTLTRRNYVESF